MNDLALEILRLHLENGEHFRSDQPLEERWSLEEIPNLLQIRSSEPRPIGFNVLVNISTM